MDYLVYDTEIVNLIPSSREGKLPRYKYCSGWGDFSGMGISVIGYYSSVSDECFHTNSPEVFQEVASNHAVIVGFNSRCFDDSLLKAHGVNVQTDYDLLEQVRIAAGFKAVRQSVPSGYSYKLDAIARVNGMAKTVAGELAPKLWQDGKRRAVIDYCLNDVKVTLELLKLGLDGKLKDPNTGALLKLTPLPEKVEQLSLLP